MPEGESEGQASSSPHHSVCVCGRADTPYPPTPLAVEEAGASLGGGGWGGLSQLRAFELLCRCHFKTFAYD